MRPSFDLPLLDLANQLHPTADLTDVTVVACQHLLVANYLMFEKLFEKGLRPERTFVIPKAYSHNPTVERLFVERGAFVWSYAYDSHDAFDERMRRETEAFVAHVVAAGHDRGRVLILDDGGDLTVVANDVLVDAACCAVEQTSSGFNKLHGAALRFPVVNLARSDSKLHVESLFIAESMCAKTLAFLREQELDVRSCLVVGNGPIGSQVHRNLAGYYPTDIFDVDAERSGLEGRLQDRIGDYDLVFACSGKLSIPYALQAHMRDGVVLVCASLREFEPHLLRRQAPVYDDPHRHLHVDGKWLVNSGFPVNFDGGVTDVIPEKIQLTHALMLAGGYQALEDAGAGLVELDPANQDRIVTAFKEYLAELYFQLYGSGAVAR